MRCLTADNPAHRRIMTQTLGVVHIFVSSKTAEDGLPQHANKSMAAILARATILAHAIDERWAFGVGARLVVRAASDDLGNGKGKSCRALACAGGWFRRRARFKHWLASSHATTLAPFNSIVTI
jgi:hypothetical protein